MLSLLRPGDVPDAQPKNKNHVGKNGQHATCSCITRNGKPQERRRCKIHQNPTPASNNYHVEGKKNGQRAICSCTTRNGNPMEARRCKIHQKSTKPIQAQSSKEQTPLHSASPKGSVDGKHCEEPAHSFSADGKRQAIPAGVEPSLDHSPSCPHPMSPMAISPSNTKQTPSPSALRKGSVNGNRREVSTDSFSADGKCTAAGVDLSLDLSPSLPRSMSLLAISQRSAGVTIAAASKAIPNVLEEIASSGSSFAAAGNMFRPTRKLGFTKSFPGQTSAVKTPAVSPPKVLAGFTRKPEGCEYKAQPIVRESHVRAQTCLDQTAVIRRREAFLKIREETKAKEQAKRNATNLFERRKRQQERAAKTDAVDWAFSHKDAPIVRRGRGRRGQVQFHVRDAGRYSGSDRMQGGLERRNMSRDNHLIRKRDCGLQDSRFSVGSAGKTQISLNTRGNEAGDRYHPMLCSVQTVPARTTRTKLDFGVQPVHTEAGPAVNQQLSSEMSDYSGEIPMSGESETRNGAGPSSRMPLSHKTTKKRGTGSGTQGVGADKSKKSKQVQPKQSVIPAFRKRSFFLDTLSMLQRNGFEKRLKSLGASVHSFMDISVDCIVSTSDKTPSTTTTGNITMQGASSRAKKLACSQGTTHLTPANFAKMHNKTLVSPKELDILLTSAENSQQQQKIARTKITPAQAHESGGRPCALRHSVRVRGVDTTFRCIDGVPEWWHFPECDRHHYYKPAAAPCMPGAALNSPDTPGRTPHGARSREATPVQAAGQHKEPAPGREARKVAGETGGYCHLCKVKHDHAKAHADSKGHQRVVEALLVAGDPRVKAPRQIEDWEWKVNS